MGAAAGSVLGLGLALCAAPAAARPFTVDDLLAQEQVGAAAFSPDGRWAVFERQGPYDTGVRFDLGQNNRIAASRLMIASAAGGPARAWLGPDLRPGQVFGGFSPSGVRAAVFQLQGDRWRLGVVESISGTVSWLDLAPEGFWSGRDVAWLDDDTLLVLTRPEPGLPARLREGGLSAARLPGLWAAAARGELAASVVGSGRDRDARPRPAPRRLVQADVRSGALRVLATGEIVDFEPAPDGRTVAILEAGEDLQAWPGRSLHGAWGLADQARRLGLIDRVTGRRADPCPVCDVLDTLLAWSPDGSALLVFAREARAPWTAGGFWRVARSGRAERLTAPPFTAALRLRPERVEAGWIGPHPVVLGRSGDASPAWWRLSQAGAVRLGRDLPAPGRVVAADARGLTVLSGGRLWRLDPGGDTVRFGPDRPLRLARAPAARDGRTAWAWPAHGWARADGEAPAPLLHVGGAGVTAIASIPGGAEVLATGPTTALLGRATSRGVLDLVLTDQAGRTGALATLNGRLADVDPLEVRAVSHPGPDGRPLRSWLFLPARTPGAPPPLIVKVYAGDVHADWPRPKPPVLGFVADVRVLVGEGYAVLVPSLPLANPPLPGPRLPGPTRPDPTRPDPSTADPVAGLADRILGIVATAAQDPALRDAFDPDRLAVVGQSYGGYTVGAVLTQTGRFRAAVAQSGYYDLVAEWAGLAAPLRSRPEPGLRSNAATGGIEAAQGRMGAPPWADPARYARNSPLLTADRITTPLLLLHGDQDANVDLIQSEAMFSALYRQGKDAQLVTYWGEGHTIASPGNVRDLYGRMFDFLETHLSDARVPASARRGPGSANTAPTPRSPPP